MFLLFWMDIAPLKNLCGTYHHVAPTGRHGVVGGMAPLFIFIVILNAGKLKGLLLKY